MAIALGDKEKDVLFREARSYNSWQDRGVDDAVLRELYDLVKMGPTSANCCPARFVFVKSAEAKERLKPHLAEGNIDKAMTAPVNVLVAMDMKFYERFDVLFPHGNARSWFEGKPKAIEETAARNTSLQGAYLIMAARSLGLDCGPLSGFDGEGVAQEFFAGQDVKMDLICNIGYGDPDGLFDRLPRFEFDDVSVII